MDAAPPPLAPRARTDERLVAPTAQRHGTLPGERPPSRSAGAQPREECNRSSESKAAGVHAPHRQGRLERRRHDLGAVRWFVHPRRSLPSRWAGMPLPPNPTPTSRRWRNSDPPANSQVISCRCERDAATMDTTRAPCGSERSHGNSRSLETGSQAERTAQGGGGRRRRGDFPDRRSVQVGRRSAQPVPEPLRVAGQPRLPAGAVEDVAVDDPRGGRGRP